MTRWLAVLAATLLPAVALGENWPQWRGPFGNGVAAGEGYPVRWSRTENVAWKVKLPGIGSSTPIVWEDHIFLTCPLEEQNGVLCFDRTGRLRWQQRIGRVRHGKHKKGSGTNPSPVTDGKNVWVYFKSGDLACLDFSGNVLWRHNLQQMYGEDTLWWDLGTSPVLTRDFVVVAVMHSGPSYLVAFEKQTGAVAWKQDRNLDAPVESAQSYTTPQVIRDGGRELIVVLGADHVTCHDAATGREIWRVGGLNPTGHKYFRSIASPAVSVEDQMVIAPYARGQTLTAIRLGGEGDVTQSHVAWVLERRSADVPTPIAHRGKVYVVTDRGQVSCLRITDGHVLWEGQLERNRNNYSSSPVLGGDKLYLTREDGTTFVLATDRFAVLAKNTLDEFTVATPALVDGQILLRTAEHLWCIGKRSENE